MCRKYVRRFLAFCLCVGLLCTNVKIVAAQEPVYETLPRLAISEVQTGGLTGGAEDGRKEFIELYNPGQAVLDVTDWRIEYLSASHNGMAAPTRILAVLEGQIASADYVLLSYDAYIMDADVYFGADSTASSGLLARSGGHVRVVDNTGAVVDLLAWGSGTPIGTWWKVPEIPTGKSANRILPGNSLFGVNIGYEPASNVTSPQGGGLYMPPAVDPEEIAQCAGLELSEILPNPVGTDQGHEFIEVHNPTADQVHLKGCVLRLGDGGSPFALPDIELDAGAYRAFYDSETGIVLPNAAAQTVWLLSQDAEQGVLYPNALGDNHAWALANGQWLEAQPTPNATNVMMPAEVESDDPDEVLGAMAPCAAGKERNPLTGRCKTVTSAVIATPCAVGQERNPETNRCRAGSVASTVVPCKPGQERNPATNRCRTIGIASSTLQPCPTGQQRNPDTNRCRKLAGTDADAQVQDVRTASVASTAHVWIAALVAAGAIGYAVYEWRQDISQAALRIKRKIIRSPD